jgi:predicted naringenin-chalcone synthase
MERNTYLYDLTSILPPHQLPQADTTRWLLEAHRRSGSVRGADIDVDRLSRFCLPESYIRRRYYECDEVDEDWESHAIYRITRETPAGASLRERNLFFGAVAERVLGELYGAGAPAHVVHVTCTGYLSPSPVQRFFSRRGDAPAVTHAYHMGCYASLPAIRIARGLALSEGLPVDVVHNELCSLHLDPTASSPEQMVVQSLFADGHVKYTVGPEVRGFRIRALRERIIPETADDMTWIPGPTGMAMTLSKEVPFRIRGELPAFLGELAAYADVSVPELLRSAIFAVHPGGPKIIEAVQKKLELTDAQVRHSKVVLLDRGNMSSATLPHVWKEILDASPPPGTPVVSFAFGPGLTLFGAVFEVAP